MGLGKKIKEARKKLGITQEQLAREVGIATITVRQYEAEKREPAFAILEKIAKKLQVSIAYFSTDSMYLENDSGYGAGSGSGTGVEDGTGYGGPIPPDDTDPNSRIGVLYQKAQAGTATLAEYEELKKSVMGTEIPSSAQTKHKNPLTTGDHIKFFREWQGLSQQDLADKSKLDINTIQKIENKDIHVNIRALVALAAALEIPGNYLYGDKDREALNRLSTNLKKMNNSFSSLANQVSALIKEEADRWGIDPAVSFEEIYNNLVDSFGESWGYFEFAAFLDELANTTDSEKRQTWQYIRFLKSQRDNNNQLTNNKEE